MSTKLTGLTNTLISNADKLGMVAGAITDNGISTIISSIQQLAAGVIHIPNSQEIQYVFGLGPVQSAIMAYFAGLAGEAILPSNWKKYASALQKGAVAFGAVYVAQKLLYASTHSEIKGVNIENSISQNFRNAPVARGYGY